MGATTVSTPASSSGPAKLAPLRQDGDRGEAGAVEAAGEQQQLAVGAVAARRRMQEENGRRHIS